MTTTRSARRGAAGGARATCITMVDPRGRGGIATQAAELSLMLRALDRPPRLLCLSGGAEPRLRPASLLRRGRLWDVQPADIDGVPALLVGHALAHFGAARYVWPYPAVRRWLDACDAHVVAGIPMSGITLALRRRRYVCWVTTLHADELRARAEAGEAEAAGILGSPTFPLYERQERLVLRRAAAVLAISEHTANRIRAAYPELHDGVRVVPVPVDTKRLRPRSAESRASRPATVLCIGRLDDARKNVPLLLRAFAAAAARVPAARLLLAGRGADSWRGPARELGIGDRVEHRPAGWRLDEIFHDADVFALPSRQEGLGLVGLEAMACGLPVVSTRSGGPEEYVQHGVTGFLTPLDDAEAFAARLVELLRDSTVRSRMGDAARRLVEARYARPVARARVADVLDEVFPSSAGAPIP